MGVTGPWRFIPVQIDCKLLIFYTRTKYFLNFFYDSHQPSSGKEYVIQILNKMAFLIDLQFPFSSQLYFRNRVLSDLLPAMVKEILTDFRECHLSFIQHKFCSGGTFKSHIDLFYRVRQAICSFPAG